jgi:hypothetical protein
MIIYLSGGPTLLSYNIAVPIFLHYDCPHLSPQGKKYVRTVSSHTICLYLKIYHWRVVCAPAQSALHIC